VKRLGVGLAAGLVVAGCGGSPAASGPTLRVAAAPVLQPALKRCTPKIQGVRVRLQIARSDRIGDEIRRGVLPDVLLVANTGLPRALAREGRVEAPVPYATNELVIAVPAGDSSIRGIDDLAAGGHSIGMGSVASPLGTYTRYVLSGLSTFQRIQVLSNVRVQEPNAQAVVDKVVAQEVQAAFVFRSDAASAGGRLRTIALPSDLSALVVYAMAVVRGAPQPGAARKVMRDILHGGCARALRDAGFGAPPR
jgi:molybdate transport system substrate-binding protein